MSMTRDFGRIKSVRWDEDHCAWWVVFDGGTGEQGFGGIPFRDVVEAAFKKELADFFGVRTLQELVGRECFALRCFDFNHEPIEGFELEGRVWTLTGFVKRHVPGGVRSRLETRVASCIGEIENFGRRIEEERGRLTSLEGVFVDWEAKETQQRSSPECVQCRHPGLKGIHTCREHDPKYRGMDDAEHRAAQMVVLLVAPEVRRDVSEEGTQFFFQHGSSSYEITVTARLRPRRQS